MKIVSMVVVAAMALTSGCKSYVIDVAADGSKHIALTNIGFDTKVDGMRYKHGDTQFDLQGYGSESRALELVTEIVKRIPVK